MASVFHCQDQISLVTTFTNAAGVPTAPGTITFTVTKPDGTSADYTGVALTNTGTGVYRLFVTPAVGEDGTWTFRNVGSGGGVNQVDQGYFLVAPAA